MRRRSSSRARGEAHRRPRADRRVVQPVVRGVHAREQRAAARRARRHRVELLEDHAVARERVECGRDAAAAERGRAEVRALPADVVPPDVVSEHVHDVHGRVAAAVVGAAAVVVGGGGAVVAVAVVVAVVGGGARLRRQRRRRRRGPQRRREARRARRERGPRRGRAGRERRQRREAASVRRGGLGRRRGDRRRARRRLGVDRRRRGLARRPVEEPGRARRGRRRGRGRRAVAARARLGETRARRRRRRRRRRRPRRQQRANADDAKPHRRAPRVGAAPGGSPRRWRREGSVAHPRHTGLLLDVLDPLGHSGHGPAQ